MIAGRPSDFAGLLGIELDMIVQELGWDDDVDEDIRLDIQEKINDEIVDSNFTEVVDVVILWWRDGDGDLVDTLVDISPGLDDEGFVWIFSPKKPGSGYVEASDIAEAALSSGFSLTLTEIFDSWVAHKFIPRRAKASRK